MNGTALAVPVLAALLLGCASKSPVFYPDERVAQVSEAQKQRDIAECRALAESVVEGRSSDAAEAARRTATGGAIGGAAGAAGGAVWGEAGRGAASGAAGGAVAGLLGWLFGPREPDPLYVNVANQCLADRGYRVVGWR